MFSMFKWSGLLGASCALSVLCFAVIGFSQSPQAVDRSSNSTGSRSDKIFGVRAE